MAAIKRHIRLNGLVAAHTLETLLLHQPKDLGLRHGGHVADFVQKQGPAVALLELADAFFIRAGKSALLMTEKLALQQWFRYGGTIECQEWAVLAAAVLVNGPRHELLASSAFAQDENRHVLGRDPADGLVNGVHGWAATHKTLRCFLLAAVFRNQLGRTHQAGDIQGTADERDQRLEIQRFEHVIKSAQGHGVDGRGGGPRAGDEDHGDPGVNLLEPLKDLQPGLVWQPQI